MRIFLYLGSNTSAPTYATEKDNVLSSFTESGYMEKILFTEWMVHFIDFLQSNFIIGKDVS